ncbi:hypothetical protein JCM10550A_23180 [Methanogenium cariaci]
MTATGGRSNAYWFGLGCVILLAAVCCIVTGAAAAGGLPSGADDRMEGPGGAGQHGFIPENTTVLHDKEVYLPEMQAPSGESHGYGGQESFLSLNHYGIDPVLLFVVVGVLAAAGGALLYRYVTGKRRRTAVPRDEAAVPFDETVAVTSSLGGPSFPDEAAVMDGSPGSTYFPLPLTERYQDVRFVGKGGIARVFCAKRRSDGEEVAVKVPISFDEVTGKMFLKEMRIWEQLSHPNIVTLFSVNILPVPFVEMEYLPGSLAEKSLPLNPAEAVEIVLGIAAGIAYAHAHGIIHRDIKPQNILITDDGLPKLTDWGLGSILADGHETTPLGFSLNYAAPEQVAPTRFGSPNERTDIYGVGVVFYECVTGVRPFSATGVAEMTTAILTDIPQAPSVYYPVLEPLDGVILRCLEKRPNDRFASADDLREALETAGNTFPPGA